MYSTSVDFSLLIDSSTLVPNEFFLSFLPRIFYKLDKNAVLNSLIQYAKIPSANFQFSYKPDKSIPRESDHVTFSRDSVWLYLLPELNIIG